MSEVESICLKTLKYVEELFAIEAQCSEIVNKKPRISKNAPQLYHNQIMEIAQGYKQLFLEIAEKKRK